MRAALRLLCAALVGAGLATYAVAALIYQPPQEHLQPNGYNRFPDGIAIGDVQNTPGVGCMGWSEIDQCFFIDGNCNYVLDRDLGERTMCECECCSTGGATCIDIGQPCTLNTECCTGICEAGVCSTGTTMCLDLGDPCTLNSQCCTGQCVAGFCANSGGASSTTSTSTSTTTSTTSTTIAFEAFAQGDCFDILGVRADSDLIYPWIAPSAQTVTGVGCRCNGDCTSPRATFELVDGQGNTISTASTLTCSVGTGTTTFVSINGMDSDRNLVEGERLGIRVTNSPASIDEVTICVTF